MGDKGDINVPVTKKGKGKMQNGKKFGKKHTEAMFEFTKNLWLQDATMSLRNLLLVESAQQAFMAFLKTEYGEAQLEFFLEVQRLDRLPPQEQQQQAQRIYQMFMATGGKGIGQQERTAATQQMWDYVNNSSNGSPDANALERVRYEAEATLNMLAFDAFPRFLKSPFCQQAVAAIRQQGGGQQLEAMLSQSDSKAPVDADDWLNIFVQSAESFPACIVISDMTIPGAPMVFVNQEFCRTTGYSREEATGRNCRFLQGPDTEPEAIQVIRNTLSKGQDCHVKLTNYRKNGEKFQNLLSMKPVFDADGIYRFVIGVQFEVKEDQNLKQRLVQLDKLLRLLPSKLNLRSKAAARAKGALAVKVTGEQNQLLGNKDAVLQQTKQMEQQEASVPEAQRRPKALASTPFETPMSQLNLDNTVFSFTRIMWLNKPIDAVNAIVGDPLARTFFLKFCEITSALYSTHFQFLCQYADVAAAQGPQQAQMMKKIHLKKNNNPIFYCTMTEIKYGTINQQNWGPIFQEMTQKQQIFTAIIGSEVLPKFLNSKFGIGLIMALRQREMSGQAQKLRTVAAGLDKNSESFWLDMFRVMSETASIGMVISDMTIPGIPLLYINEGFKAVTGYGKEKISCSCRFLQGPETHRQLDDEICEALRHADSLVIKLFNYKANGQKFHCLLGLHPVFGPKGEYKFQVGIQLDFHMHPDITRQLLEFERILRYMPNSITCTEEKDIKRCIPVDFMGDQSLYPFWKWDPSVVSSQSMGYSANASKAAEVMSVGKEVSTKKGKDKDQYGRKFGKKQKGAMLEFTKSLWLQDAVTSLRNLLTLDYAQQAMMAFLKTEYGEAQLEFYLEAMKLSQVSDMNQKAQMAVQLYGLYVSQQGKGIGQQERTAKTQELWDRANQTGAQATDPQTAMAKIGEEAENTLKMLAFDAFPRFIKSPFCEQLVMAMRQTGNPAAAQVEGLLSQAGAKGPQDADDWLNTFVSTAESFPACIVISDMTIPGAPMVFVNQEFCRTTGYGKEEATGRNCRFLQGPDTEPEAIQVIRNTLSKGQDCHVKLTNYRKNGEKFQNLLSMKPVFDADGIYRFVIGVQFEVKEDQNLKQRLVQLDKLLRLLPSKLNLRSKAAARAKGALAVKVTGEANQYINAKEQILNQAKQMEQQEASAAQTRPKEIVQTSSYDPRSLNYDQTIAAFTKIMWLQDPMNTMRGLLADPESREAFFKYAEDYCSELVRTHIRFVEWIYMIKNAPPNDQLRMIFKLHNKWDRNPLFYCTTNAIPWHTLRQVNWGPVMENINVWQEQSTFFLASEALPKFLEDVRSSELILILRRREASGAQIPLRTVCKGISPTSDTFWLDMFRVMSETVSIGMVISDMTVPGIPLVHINEGFKAVTGYGKEKIGTSCRFLQGKETESYLNDEIMLALQQSERLITKLHNYKANGQKFQCLLALQPVFGPAPDHEYKYQIGLQFDFNNVDPNLPKNFVELARILRYLPQAVNGDKMSQVDQAMQELQMFIQSGGQAPAATGGMGMGGGAGGFGMAPGAPMGGFGGAPMGGMGGFGGAPAAPMGGMGGFGGAPAAPMGGFGGAPAAPMGGMGGFGGAPAAPMGGMGGFGGAPAAPMGGMGGFGSPQPPSAAPPSFGSPRKASFNSPGSFGSPAAGGFGGSPAPGGFGF